MIAGMILAGGLGRRLGGTDKPLIEIGGRTLLARINARLGAQVDAMVVNANGDPARFADFGLPVVADDIPDFAGPLAGILAGLDWAAAHGFAQLVTVAGDTPLIPADLVERLAAASPRLAVAASGGRRHPTCGLWQVSLAADLRRALVEDGERRLNALVAAWGAVQVDWPDRPVDPFFNVNNPDDVARLTEILTP
jgi:molybdopterin-guanine dinucleotide biosynthesis protein A